MNLADLNAEYCALVFPCFIFLGVYGGFLRSKLKVIWRTVYGIQYRVS